MKKIVLIASTLVLSGLIFFSTSTQSVASSNGAPAFETGSPGDGGNCSDCHGTAAAGGTITSDIPALGYTPGATYNFSASITGSTSNCFGFELSPQNTSGTILGTLINGTSGSKLISTNRFITHNAKVVGVTSKTWTFQWTAPAAGTATTVTFYSSFLVGNNNGNNDAGDATKTTSMTYSINTSTGITENKDNDMISVFPNPTADYLHISNTGAIAKGFIYGVDGKLAKTIPQDELSGKVINVLELSKGTYFIQLETATKQLTGKFVKQ